MLKHNPKIAPFVLGMAFVCSAGLMGPKLSFASSSDSSSPEAAASEGGAAADPAGLSSEGSATENPHTLLDDTSTPAEVTDSHDHLSDTSDASVASTPEREGTVVFLWKGSEVFRESILDGKQVFWYTDDSRAKNVAGSPLTVNVDNLNEKLSTLLENAVPYRAGYDIDWRHEKDANGNLHIWPVYIKASEDAPLTPSNNNTYTFYFKWKLENGDDLPFALFPPAILQNQALDKITSNDVKDWFRSFPDDRNEYLITDENNFGHSAWNGKYTFVGLQNNEATGQHPGVNPRIDNIGYWHFTPASELENDPAGELSNSISAEPPATEEIQPVSNEDPNAHENLDDSNAATAAANSDDTSTPATDEKNNASASNSKVGQGAAQQKLTPMKALPQTGDASAVSTLFATALGLLGSGIASRRKR